MLRSQPCNYRYISLTSAYTVEGRRLPDVSTRLVVESRSVDTRRVSEGIVIKQSLVSAVLLFIDEILPGAIASIASAWLAVVVFVGRSAAQLLACLCVAEGTLSLRIVGVIRQVALTVPITGLRSVSGVHGSGQGSLCPVDPSQV